MRSGYSCFALFILLSVSTSGCMHINYVNPETGEVDPNRTHRTEGWLDAFLSATGNGVRFGKDPEKRVYEPCIANTPVYQATGWDVRSVRAPGLERLTGQLTDQQIRYSRHGDTLLVQVPQDDGYGLDEIRPEEQEFFLLERLAKVLQSNNSVQVEIAGHADSIGNEVYNVELSEFRSINIRRFLVSQGVKPEKIRHLGHGERYPLLASSSIPGQDRRVEIFVCLAES